MNMNAIIASLSIGSFAGIIYGLLSQTKAHSTFGHIATFKYLSTLRLPCLALFLFYLLRQPWIHPILVIIAFFTCFWGVIIYKATQSCTY
jgi:hypothetical protein